MVGSENEDLVVVRSRVGSDECHGCVLAGGRGSKLLVVNELSQWVSCEACGSRSKNHPNQALDTPSTTYEA